MEPLWTISCRSSGGSWSKNASLSKLSPGLFPIWYQSMNITHKNGYIMLYHIDLSWYHDLSVQESENNKIGPVKSVATKGVIRCLTLAQKKDGHWSLKATTYYPAATDLEIVFPQNDKYGIPCNQRQTGDNQTSNFLALSKWWGANLLNILI